MDFYILYINPNKMSNNHNFLLLNTLVLFDPNNILAYTLCIESFPILNNSYYSSICILYYSRVSNFIRIFHTMKIWWIFSNFGFISILYYFLLLFSYILVCIQCTLNLIFLVFLLVRINDNSECGRIEEFRNKMYLVSIFQCGFC